MAGEGVVLVGMSDWQQGIRNLNDEKPDPEETPSLMRDWLEQMKVHQDEKPAGNGGGGGWGLW